MPLTQNHRLAKPITAKVTGLDVWGETGEDKCLVIELDSPDLSALYKFYKDHYNASSDYDEFKPHITISYNYQNEALHLDLFHEMLKEVVFDEMQVQPMDASWLV